MGDMSLNPRTEISHLAISRPRWVAPGSPWPGMMKRRLLEMFETHKSSTFGSEFLEISRLLSWTKVSPKRIVWQYDYGMSCIYVYIYIYYLYSIIYICGSSTVSLKQRLEMARRCPWSPRAFPLLDAAAATASGSGSAAEAGGGRGAAVEVGGACGHGSIMDPSWPVDAVYPPTFTLQHDRNMSFTTFTITLTYLTWYAIA